MPNSLKCQIKKLAHEGKITEEEANELILKLDGHDKQIKADMIDAVCKEIANWNVKSSKKIPYEFARYLEQLKEGEEYDKSIR